jgi:hypothetical protein
VRAGKRRAAASRPACRFEHHIVHVPPAQPSRMRVHRLWGGLMRACGGRGAAASWLRALPRARAASITCCAANHVKRHRAAEASIRPTSVRRGRTCATLALARGRRALHGSSSSSKSSQQAARSTLTERPPSPRRPLGFTPENEAIGAFIVVGTNRIAVDAAPRCCVARSRVLRVALRN